MAKKRQLGVKEEISSIFDATISQPTLQNTVHKMFRAGAEVAPETDSSATPRVAIENNREIKPHTSHKGQIMISFIGYFY